jgi:hypothetical protein
LSWFYELQISIAPPCPSISWNRNLRDVDFSVSKTSVEGDELKSRSQRILEIRRGSKKRGEERREEKRLIGFSGSKNTVFAVIKYTIHCI